MTLRAELEAAKIQLFMAEMSDCIGGSKVISEARAKVDSLQKQVNEAGA